MRSGVCVCAYCGSLRVQIMDWIDPNTAEIVGGNDSPSSGEQWCARCSENGAIEWLVARAPLSLGRTIRENARRLRREAREAVFVEPDPFDDPLWVEKHTREET